LEEFSSISGKTNMLRIKPNSFGQDSWERSRVGFQRAVCQAGIGLGCAKDCKVSAARFITCKSNCLIAAGHRNKSRDWSGSCLTSFRHLLFRVLERCYSVSADVCKRSSVTWLKPSFSAPYESLYLSGLWRCPIKSDIRRHTTHRLEPTLASAGRNSASGR